ncbi:MAG TPA: HEAT repeat domain-containing protein, partial [Candidatus Ozemobacteraceae bacterium]|nr:HEAT repeat domain-containing protein [Candidatus Ozemobacteraceae bacterium]
MTSLGDTQRIVSDYACEVLARKANLKIDLLLEHLETEDENVRFQVIKTIGQIGGLAFNPIIKILQNGKKEERLFLLGVLQKINPNDKLIEALVQLLGDPGWPIRNAAANCLRSYGEKAVSAVVRVLNSSNDDVQFWSRRVLLSMGSAAVIVLTQILRENSDPAMTPHIISALLSMNNTEAVPAVLAFLENSDDSRVKEVMGGIPEISSREVVDTILNLINHPVDRVVYWLAEILKKVSKPNLRRIVLLGLNHSEDRSRHFVLEAISGWKNVSDPELKTVVRQLEVEKSPRNILDIARVLGRNPSGALIEPLKTFLGNCEPDLMLDFMLSLMESERPGYEGVLAETLKTRSHGIKMDDVEKVGRILGLVYKSKTEGTIT